MFAVLTCYCLHRGLNLSAYWINPIVALMGVIQMNPVFLLLNKDVINIVNQHSIDCCPSCGSMRAAPLLPPALPPPPSESKGTEAWEGNSGSRRCARRAWNPITSMWAECSWPVGMETQVPDVQLDSEQGAVWTWLDEHAFADEPPFKLCYFWAGAPHLSCILITAHSALRVSVCCHRDTCRFGPADRCRVRWEKQGRGIWLESALYLSQLQNGRMPKSSCKPYVSRFSSLIWYSAHFTSPWFIHEHWSGSSVRAVTLHINEWHYLLTILGIFWYLFRKKNPFCYLKRREWVFATYKILFIFKRINVGSKIHNLY